MNEETRETSEGEVGYSYAGYVACGGRIDQENYDRVMATAHRGGGAAFAQNQTKVTADISGVSLDAIHSETGINPRTIYEILRRDVGTAEQKHHHGQMSDQQLLVESLRMLEQEDAVRAIIAKHPHIDFN